MTTTLSEPAKLYLSSDVGHFDTGSESIAYRVFGQGLPLLFIHGFSLHGFTIRKLLPHLVDDYTCYVVDRSGNGRRALEPRHRLLVPEARRAPQEFHAGAGGAGALRARTRDGHHGGALLSLGRPRADETPRHHQHRDPAPPTALGAVLSLGARVALRQGGMRILLRSDLYLRSSVCLGGGFEDPHLLDSEFKEFLAQQ